MDMSTITALDPYSEADFKRLLDAFDANARAMAAEFEYDWDNALGVAAGSHGIPTQVLSIARAGLFDADYYLKINRDIAALGVNPLRHYVEYGDAEGRWPNPQFNPKVYRTYFEEGALKGICSLYHYALVGEALGVCASLDFDGRRYLATYPLLASWLDRPLAHFLNLGRHHGLVLHHRIRLAGDQQVQLKERAPLQEPVYVEDNPSINIVGPVDKVSGLGVSARGYIEGLRRAGYNRLGAQSQPLAFGRQSNIPPDEFPLPPFIESAPINVVHMNGDTLPLMLDHGGYALLKGAHNIAVWYWELPVLRPEWYVSLKYFQEFWAPTPFIADTLRAATSKRVTLLPPYLNYLRNEWRSQSAPLGEKRYFLYCFDANSILERKNPMCLVKAFLNAFSEHGQHADVELVLKVTYPDLSVDEVSQLYAHADMHPRIKIIDELLPSEALHTLIANAIAYVSPHRSEGLGLTVIEAMAAEVPVISTSFGGLSAFVDETTAWPVDFDLVELADEYHPYPRGFVWGDPKPSSLATQMRAVVENPVMAVDRAQRAKARVIEYFASEALLSRYRQAIGSLKSPVPASV